MSITSLLRIFDDFKSLDQLIPATLKMLEAVGNPHLDVPNVIHVIGTNGKGSTVAGIKAVLEAHGKSVNAHFSPYMKTPRDRIHVLGEVIDEARYLKFFRQAKEALGEEFDDVSEEYFRTNEGFEDLPELAKIKALLMSWLVTMLAFKERPAEYAVIETFAGGRRAATNTFDPLLVVLTKIGMDHMAYFGDNLSDIAYEKAGAMKSGVPCLCTDYQPEEALTVVKQEAEHIGAKLLFPTDVLGISIDPAAMASQQNAETALAASKVVLGDKFDRDLAESVLAQTNALGRTQRLDKVSGPEWLPQRLILDVAHNEDGFKNILQLTPPGVTKIFSVLAKKEIGLLIEEYKQGDTIEFVKCAGIAHPQLVEFGIKPHETLEDCLQSLGPQKEEVMIGGSFDMVRYVIKEYGQYYKSS